MQGGGGKGVFEDTVSGLQLFDLCVCVCVCGKVFIWKSSIILCHISLKNFQRSEVVTSYCFEMFNNLYIM